jgi:PAS domain S-box-containing protein
MRRFAAFALWLPSLVIAIVGVSLSLVIFAQTRNADEISARDDMELRVEWRTKDFEHKIRNATEGLEAVATLMSSQHTMDAATFHGFARLLHGEVDFGSELDWAPWVKGEDRSTFVAAARKSVAAGYDITDVTADGHAAPAPEGEAYLPILYQEAGAGQALKLGHDVLRRPEIKLLVLAARDQGRPIATPPLEPQFGPTPTPGYGVLWPVYATGTVPASVAERRSAFLGMAIMRLRLDLLLPAAISATPKILETLDISVDGGSAGAAPIEVAHFDPQTSQFTYGGIARHPAAAGLLFVREFDILGRRWILAFDFSPEAAALHPSSAWARLLLGLSLTGLAMIFAFREQKRRSVVEEAVKNRTAELTQEVELRRRQELAAKSSAARLQAVVDTAVHGVMVADETGSIQLFNRAAERLFGYPAAEVVGQKGFMLLAPPFGDEYDRLLQNFRRTGDRKVLGGQEIVGRRKDGSTFPMEIAVGDGRHDGLPIIVAVVSDLTERKRVETALRQWGEVFAKAAFGIVVTDAKNATITLVNPAYAAMHGMTAEEMQGKSLFDAYAPSEHDRLPGLLATTDSEGHVAYEALHIRKDGSTFTAQKYLASVRDADGAVLYRIGSAFDISDRKAVERELSRSEERYDELIDKLPYGIIIHVDGKIVFANPVAARALHADSADRLIGMSALDIIHPDDRAAVIDDLRDITQGTLMTDPVERRILRLDGSICPVESLAIPLQFGGKSGFLIAANDITSRKSAELARTEMEAQLRQSQKMEAIGNLTGGMAHDFNNLLGVIIGNLDIALPQAEKLGDAGDRITDAIDAALRGAELTRQLLAFARRQPLQPRRIDVNELVTGMVKLLRRTIGENVEISLNLAGDVWPLLADRAQVESALMNLANNARDAMPASGRLTIATANRHLDADYAAAHVDVAAGDYVVIEVSDTGTGMTAEVASRIFEPFFTTKEQDKGTGLGLSMVFGFVKQSGGHVNVYSEVGVGTTFRLYLPRAAQVPAEVGAPAVLAPPGAKGETVLAVEDNEALLRVVVRQLEKLGYRAIEARSPVEALALLEREKVDLLLTDIVMPGGMDGYGLARAVRSRWPGIKVVLTSGFPETRINGQLATTAPSAGLLSKPYRRDDLAHALRNALDAA